MKAGFPRVQRREKDGERKVPREGGTRYGEGYEEAGWRNRGRVRIGGGLKGSERLDKSNPLKVRPTLCLPMRLRISRLRVPDSPERKRPEVGKREKPRRDTKRANENETRARVTK